MVESPWVAPSPRRTPGSSSGKSFFHWTPACAGATALGVVLLAACASQSKRHDAELAQLLEWYPGHYSSVAQAQEDVEAGREPHEALELNIVRVYAPRIGDYVFYVQETASYDPQQIVSQRLASFEVVKDRGIVQSLWSLTEPKRWRHAHRDPDFFKGMMPQDFAPLAGCDLLWTKEEGRFVGANDLKTCRATSPKTGGTVRMELRAQLTPDELVLTNQSYDVAGRLVQGHAAEPAYRFRRR
jgi:hypothetical protein